MRRITVVVPAAQAAGVRRALRTSQRVAAEDVEYSGRRRRRRPSRTGSSALLAEVTRLLDQLSAGRLGDVEHYEPLRTAGCDVLVVAIEQLACAAHRHWTQRPSLAEVRCRLASVVAGVELLERIDEARRAAEACQRSG